MCTGVQTVRAERTLHWWLLPCLTSQSERMNILTPLNLLHILAQDLGKDLAWIHRYRQKCLVCDPGGMAEAILNLGQTGPGQEYAGVHFPGRAPQLYPLQPQLRTEYGADRSWEKSTTRQPKSQMAAQLLQFQQPQ